MTNRFMTNKFKIMLSVLIALISLVICGLVAFSISSAIYKKNNGIYGHYEIMMRDNYEVYVGESFELAPKLIKNGKIVDNADFTFTSDDAAITVSKDGLVNVGERENGTAHITVYDERFDVTKNLTLRIINELYSVSGILYANEYINEAQVYEMGKEYCYTVASLPEVVAVSQYTEVSCVDEAGNASDSLDVRYDGKNIYITPRCLGTGNIVLNVANPNCDVDFEEAIPFSCYFKEEAINDGIMRGHESSLVSRSELNGLTQLVIDEDVNEISFAELTKLPSLKRVVFTGTEVVDVVGDIPGDYAYRVKGKNLFFKYLRNKHWKSAYDSIICYENNYDEKYIIYHTDTDHPVAGFENGMDIVAWNGELIYDYESVGYENPIWKTGYGENETVVANRDLRDLSDGKHVYANWTPKTYTVTFEDYNDGFNEELKIKYLATVDELNEFEPSKTGYSFEGWYFDENYIEPFTVGYQYELAQDISVYAKYTTNIRLDYDAGSNEGRPDYIDAVYNKPVALPSLDDEGGWTFDGWYTSRGGYRGQKIDSTKPYLHENEQCLYAVWSCDIPIEFSKSDFSNFKATEIRYIHGLTFKELYNMTENSLFSREEYANIYSDGKWTFDGLYTDKNELVDKYNSATKLTPSSVLRADFVSSVLFKYAHDRSKEKTVLIRYGGELTFVSDEWGNIEGKPSMGVTYDAGYTFKGWQLASDSSQQLISAPEEYFETVSYAYANREYLAHYDINEYKIKFITTKELDGNYTDVNVTDYSYTVENNEIVLPELKPEVGYIGSWIEYNVGGGYIKFEAVDNKWKVPIGVIGDMTIKGLYAAEAYQIHYYIDNECKYTVREIKYGYNMVESEYNVTPSCPVNYTFEGWYSDRAYELEWKFGKEYDNPADTTLYAKYTMEVNFKSGLVADGSKNDGDLFGGGSMTTDRLQYKVVYGKELKFPVMKSRDWEFFGWVDIDLKNAPDFFYDSNTNSFITNETEGDNKFNIYNYSEQKSINSYSLSTNSYYAIWTKSVSLNTGTDKITIADSKTDILAVHGLTLEHTCSDEVFNGSIFNYGEYSKWKFSGWFNSKGDKITKDIALTDSTSLQAKFCTEAKFTDKDKTVDVDVVLGEPLSQYFCDEKLEDFVQSVQAGYKLAWKYNNVNYYPDSNETVDVGVCNSPFELNGIPIQYTISFTSTEKAQNMPEKVTIAYKQADDIATSAPSRTGYNFAGWSYNGNVYKVPGTLPKTLTTVDNAVIEFSATWTAKEYNILLNYNSNEGTSDEKVAEVVYDCSYKMPQVPDESRKKGYDLIGWSFSANMAVVYEAGDAVKVSALEPRSIDENITLYAQWKPIHYTVVYNFGINGAVRAVDSAIKASVDVEYDSVDKKYVGVVRSGYTFIGWQSSDGTVHNVGASIENLTDEKKEVELTAVWEAIKYQIDYKDANGNSIQDAEYTFDDWSINGNYFIEYTEGEYTLCLSDESKFTAKDISVPRSTEHIAGQYYYWSLDELACALVTVAQKINTEFQNPYVVTPKTAYVPYKVEYKVKNVTVKTVYYSVSPTESFWTELQKNPLEYFKKHEPDKATLDKKLGEGVTVTGWNYDEVFSQQSWTFDQLGDYVVNASINEGQTVYTLTITSESGVSHKGYSQEDLIKRGETYYCPLSEYTFATVYKPDNVRVYDNRDSETNAILVPFNESHVDTYVSKGSRINFYVNDETLELESVTFGDNEPMLYNQGFTYTVTTQLSVSPYYSVNNVVWTEEPEKVEYTITYMAQNGKDVVATSTYTKDNPIKAPPVPEYKCGHEINHADRYFAAWDYGNILGNEKNISGDLKIYPVYTPKTYAVEYIAYKSFEDYKYDNGYVYEYGWYTDAEPYSVPPVPTDINGLDPGKAGWSTNYINFDFIYGKTTKVYITYDDFTVVYFDTYVKKDGFIDDNPDLSTLNPIPGTRIRVSKGDPDNVPKEGYKELPGLDNNKMPNHSGYSFKRFYAYNYSNNIVEITKYNYAIAYTLGLQTLDGAICIYIEWEPIDITVTLNVNGGVGNNIEIPLKYGEELSNKMGNEIPQRAGYHLLGYTTLDGEDYYLTYIAGNEQNANAIWESIRWNIAEDTTLYAKWDANTYVVTLDQQDGTDATTTVTATYDQSMPSATKPSRVGYTFSGYYKDINGKRIFYYDSSMKSEQNWNIAEDTTLFAKWDANTYVVTLDQQGGTDGTPNVTVTYDQPMTRADKPSRTGYNFAGYYYIDANDQKTFYYDGSMKSERNWNIAEDTTLYAKWDVKYYTLKATSNKYSWVNTNPSTDSNGISVAYGTLVSFTYGYTNGGDEKLNCSVEKATVESGERSGKFYMPDRDVTISVSAGKSCVATGTLILLPDGTQTPIETLKVGDMILAYDFVSQSYVETPICLLVYHGDAINTTIELEFDDGTVLTLVGMHELFDVTKMEYVEINNSNCTNFVGDVFLGVNNECKTLLNAKIGCQYTGAYSIVSAYHFNCITDGVISATPTIPIYSLISSYIDDDMSFDIDSFNDDVEKYGLYEYEAFDGYISYEQYEQLMAPYFKLAVEKGFTTFEEIYSLMVAFSYVYK